MNEEQKKAYIRSLANNTNQRIADTYKYFDNVIEGITDPYKNLPGWQKTAIGVGGVVYEVLEKGWQAVTGAISGTLSSMASANELLTRPEAGIIQPMVNFQPGGGIQINKDAALNEVKGFYSQLFDDALTNVSLAGISIGSTAQNLTDEFLSSVGVETNWNTRWATDATRQLVANNARSTYFRMTGQTDTLEGEEQDRDAIENYSKYSAYIQESYSEEYINQLNLINDIKKNADKLINNDVIRGALGKELADIVFADNELYQGIAGVAGSMAAVLVSRLVARLIPGSGGAALGQLFFGTQVLGNTFSEAMDNGATIRDAWTYAATTALIETGIEQLGGFKPGGGPLPKITDFDSVLRFFKTVGKNAFEEGLEELASETIMPAFDIYNLSPDKQMDPAQLKRLQMEGTAKRLFVAFVSGAVSGGIFGGVQYLRNRNTLNERINLWEEAQKIKVTEKNKGEVLRTVAAQARNLVAALNDPRTKGYNINGKLTTLDTKEKFAYINQSGLGNLVDIDWSNSVLESEDKVGIEKAIELGDIQFKLNDSISFDDTLFKARFGVNADNTINYVDSDVYAVNSATNLAGVDLENSQVGESEAAPFTLATKENLNDAGRIILNTAKDYKVPVVVLSAKDDAKKLQEKDNVAFYLNGVIYVNQDAENINQENIREEIARHEIIHLLAKNNPKAYQKLKDIVGEVLDIQVNFDAQDLRVDITARKGKEKLFEFLKKSGFIEKIQSAFKTIVNREVTKVAQNIDVRQLSEEALERVRETITQKASDQIAEEIVAYFIETSVKDSQSFLNALKGVDTGLFGTFQALLQEENIIKKQTEGFKSSERAAVRRAFRTLAKGVTQVVRESQTVGFLINKVLGNNANNAQYMFAPSAIATYGSEALLEALAKVKFRKAIIRELISKGVKLEEAVRGPEEGGTETAEATPLTNKTYVKIRNLETNQIEEVALEDILIFDSEQMMNKISFNKNEEEKKTEKQFLEKFDFMETISGKGARDEAAYFNLNVENATLILGQYNNSLRLSLEGIEIILQGINVSDSAERNEILNKKLRTEKKLLVLQSLNSLFEAASASYAVKLSKAKQTTQKRKIPGVNGSYIFFDIPENDYQRIEDAAFEMYKNMEREGQEIDQRMGYGVYALFIENNWYAYLSEDFVFNDGTEMVFKERRVYKLIEESSPQAKEYINEILEKPFIEYRDFIRQIVTQETTFDKTILEKLAKDLSIETRYFDNFLEALAGRTFVLSPEVKQRVIALAYNNARKSDSMDFITRPGVTVSQAKSTADIKAVTTIFAQLKRFLENHSPFPQFRTKAWVNSGWRTTSANDPGALSLYIDLSQDILSQFGGEYNGQKNPDYIEARESIIEGYTTLLESLLTGSTNYIDGDGNTRTRTFNRDDWEYDVLEAEDAENRPLAIEIFIYPTEQLVQKQIEKAKRIEEARINSIAQISNNTEETNARELINNLKFGIESVLKIALEEKTRPSVFNQKQIVSYSLNPSFPFEAVSKVFEDLIKVKSPFEASNIDNRGKALSEGQKDYFKDTILRDEKGSLITLFHGSTAVFDSFTFKFLGEQGLAGGPGFYFGDSLLTANSYTKTQQEVSTVKMETEEGAMTRPFYLNIQKPLIRFDGDFMDSFENYDTGINMVLEEGVLKVNLTENNDTAAVKHFTKEDAKNIIRTLSNKFNLSLKETIRGFLSTSFDYKQDVYSYLSAFSRYYFTTADGLKGQQQFDKEKIQEVLNAFSNEEVLLDMYVNGKIVLPNEIIYIVTSMKDYNSDYQEDYLESDDDTYNFYLRNRMFVRVSKYLSNLSAKSFESNTFVDYLEKILLSQEQGQTTITKTFFNFLKEGKNGFDFIIDGSRPSNEELPGVPPFSSVNGFQVMTFLEKNFSVYLAQSNLMSRTPKIVSDEGKLTRTYTSMFLDSINEATGYDGVIDFRENYKFTNRKGMTTHTVSEKIEYADFNTLRKLFGATNDARVHYIAWNQNQIKSTTNYMPVKEGTPYESYETEESDIFKKDQKAVFDENNIAFVVPESFTAAGVKQAIQKASESSSAMVVLVPINVATTQMAQTTAIPDDYKVIHFEYDAKDNFIPLNVEGDSRVREIRYGFLYIAKKDSAEYANKNDFRVQGRYKSVYDFDYKYISRRSMINETFVREMNEGAYDSMYQYVIDLNTPELRSSSLRLNEVYELANPETKALIQSGSLTNFLLIGSKGAKERKVLNKYLGTDVTTLSQNLSALGESKKGTPLFFRNAIFSPNIDSVTVSDILYNLDEKVLNLPEETPMSKVTSFAELSPAQKKQYEEIFDKVKVNSESRRLPFANAFLMDEGAVKLETFSNGKTYVPYIDTTDESETKEPTSRLRLFAVVNYRGVRIPFYTSTIETKDGVSALRWYNHLGVRGGKDFDKTKIAYVNELNTELHRSFGGSPMILALSEYLSQQVWNFKAIENEIDAVIEEAAENTDVNYINPIDLETINIGYDVENSNAFFIPPSKFENEFKNRITPLDEQFVLDMIQSPSYMNSMSAIDRILKYARENYEPDGPMNKVSASKAIDPKQTEALKKLFGDYFFNKSIQLDKNGNYVLVNREIFKDKISPNEVNLNLGLFNGSFNGATHAINIPYGKHDISVNARIGKDFKIMKLSELNPKQKIMYDFMISTNIPFMFYSSEDNAAGFSYSMPTFNVSFMNAKYLDISMVADTLFHENFHEIFKINKLKTNQYASLIAKLVFTTDANGKLDASDFGKELFKLIGRKGAATINDWKDGFEGFISYYKRGYSSKEGEKIDTIEKMNKVLLTPLDAQTNSNIVDVKNELVAQLTGYILSDKYFVEKVIGADPVSGMTFFQLVSDVMGNPAVPLNTKNLMESLMQEYKSLTDNLQQKFFNLFPTKASYTLADINEFVRVFTEGKYTTKANLIQAYTKERYSNKEKGEASIALNNIIYVASLYAKTAKSAAETFIELENELNKLLDGSFFLLTSGFSKTFKVLSPDSMNKVFARLGKFVKIFEGLRNGDIFSRTLLDNGMTLSQSGMDLNKKNTIYIVDFLEKMSQEITDLLDFIEDMPVELQNSLFSEEEIKSLGFGGTNFGLRQILETMQKLVADSITEIDAEGEENFDFTAMTDPKTGNTYNNFNLTVYVVQSDAILKSNPFLQKIAFLRSLITQKTKSVAGVQALVSETMDTLFSIKFRSLGSSITSSTSSALDRLTSKPLQGASPLSQELKDFLTNLQELKGIINEVASGLANNQTAIYEKIKTVLKKIGDDYFNVVTAKFTPQEQQENGAEIAGDLEKFTTYIVSLFGDFAKLLGNDSFFVEIPKSLFSNEDSKAYTKSEDFQKLVYNEKRVARALAGLITLLETRYTTSLSGDQTTHDEYAEEKIKELQQNVGKKIPKSDVENLPVITPQDYMTIMIEKHKKTTDLFQTLFDGYKKAVRRFEDITVDFDKRYLAYKRKNPKIQKFSVEEKIELDYSYFVELSLNEYTKILGEYNNISNKENEVSEKKQTELEALKKAKEQANQDVKDLIVKLNSKRKGSLAYKQIQAQLRAARKVLKDATQEVTKTRKDLKHLNDNKTDKIEYIKTKVAEKVQETGRKIDNKLTLGQIVALYMSLKREVEMAEIYKKETENGEISDFRPTNHFSVLGTFEAFDNELLRKKGIKTAKASKRDFVILQEKQKQIAYLSSIINTYPEAANMLQFAKESFDANYEYLNETFKERYKRNLPRQFFYIPFSTIDGEYARELKLKLVRRNNAGVAQGLVTQTTLGATIPLKIENVFAVIENHSRATSRYSFDRLLKDFQNLWVNRGTSKGPANLSQLFSGTNNAIGFGNDFYNIFMQMFVDILGYGEEVNGLERFLQKRLRDLRAQTLSFGLGSPIKQLGSISNIAMKNGLNVGSLIKNITKNLVFDIRRAKANSVSVTDTITWIRTIYSSKFFKYLMDNNSNFYLRAKVSNVPDLAREINSSTALVSARVIEKINQAGLLPMQLLDTAVLLGAFETIYENKIKELTKQGLTGPELEAKALAQSNDAFEEVLLYGVANTSAAYRSRFTNDKSTLMQVISKFQSENVLHVSSILREFALVRAGLRREKELLSEILAWIISNLYSAIVNSAFALAYGYTTIGTLKAGEFLFQEFLIDSMLGSIPVVNQLSALVRIGFGEDGIKLEEGYSLRIPVLSEATDILAIIRNGFINQDTGEFKSRNLVRVITKLSSVFGIPLTNLDKIGRLIAGALASGGDPWAIDVVQWYRGTSNATEFTNAIKTGNTTYIESFAEQAFENSRVVNHITDLLASDASLRLSLKDEDYFIYQNKDGERERKDIPSTIKTRYRRLTALALQRVISKSKYRSLKPKQKVAVLQRIINYYYNYMKDIVLREKKVNLDSGTIEQVIERSVNYEYN